MVLSSIGAGRSKMHIGLGVGMFFTFHLRHVLVDHTGQEEAFGALGPMRVTIVRATYLTANAPVGRLVTFGDTDKFPTFKTDRADLAVWITNKITGLGPLPREFAVNVTGCPSKK